MNKNSHIGIKIQYLRKEKKMTQEELSEKSNVAYATLIKIERGSVKNPTVRTMEKLAKALNVTVDDILTLKITHYD